MTDCSAVHSGYEEFTAVIRDRIEQAVDNDKEDFSRKPGRVTNSARSYVSLYQRWFVNKFNRWFNQVTQAKAKSKRKCLTEKFPDHSPGNLDQEGV